MTQQPYYPPQYPQAPQPQQYVQPPAQQAPPPYPTQPQQPYPPYPQQGYPQQQPQQPQIPLAEGSLDAFYSQPSVGGGPSISWTDKQTQQPKPIGTTYAGIVARDVTNADVQQQTDIKTGQPQVYRDGRPKFAMKVPLKVQPSQEFPEGEASWFVKGQARDELVRAMIEAGVSGSPKAGDAIQVTLVQRRPSGPGMNPANIVQVNYQPAQQPVQQQVTEPPQSFAQQQQLQAYTAQQQPQQAAPPQQAAQVPAQQPAVPEGLSADQAALLARLTGGQG
ncbi:MAG: hypothetical protein QM638_01110 [Nocardioides sp.]|uniref:hypothetical protein n=1 Tax=Nocardioides sp. TaxID=35761 RepID=UPI0039E435C8